MRNASVWFAMVAAGLLAAPASFAGEGAANPKPAKQEGKAAQARERQCSMPTSPRLQKKDDECAQAREWSRSYSGDEVRGTGQGNSEALRRLDPRLN